MFLLRRPVFARPQPSPPTGYSSLFHITRLLPPAEIAPPFFFLSPLFLFSTVRAVPHIALRSREREREKCLENTGWPPCGPTTIFPPSIRAVHTCTCRRIVDKKPVTYPREVGKKNWWKIARGRRDTDSSSFSHPPLPPLLPFLSRLFFPFLSTGRIHRFSLSLSLSSHEENQLANFGGGGREKKGKKIR